MLLEYVMCERQIEGISAHVCVTVWLTSVCNRCRNRKNGGQGHARSHFILQWFPWCGTVAHMDRNTRLLFAQHTSEGSESQRAG